MRGIVGNGDRYRIVASDDPRLIGEYVTLIGRSSWFKGAWETTAPTGWWKRPDTWRNNLRGFITGHHWDSDALEWDSK